MDWISINIKNSTDSRIQHFCYAAGMYDINSIFLKKYSSFLFYDMIINIISFYDDEQNARRENYIQLSVICFDAFSCVGKLLYNIFIYIACSFYYTQTYIN